MRILPFNICALTFFAATTVLPLHCQVLEDELQAETHALCESQVRASFMPDAFSTYLSSGGAVYFSNQSVNSDQYSWDFGDATGIVNERNPVHHYSSEGIYNVKLIVSNADHCVDSMDIMIVVLDDLGHADVMVNEEKRLSLIYSTQSGNFHLSLKPGVSTDLHLKIVGLHDRVIFENQWQSLNELDYQIPAQDFSAGVYLVKVRSGNQPERTFKLIK